MLALDTSALLKRYIAEEESDHVLQRMAADPQWCASALALSEAHVTICHLGFDTVAEHDLVRALRADWERFFVVPVDDRCLERASEIGCAERVRTLDALHLAAADRLPRPVTFLTFDARQANAARSLGLDVSGV